MLVLSCFFILFSLTLLCNQCLAIDKSATGFYYPTGTNDLDTDAGWLASNCNGGSGYNDDDYHIGHDFPGTSNEDNPTKVYPIADGTIVKISYNGWGTGNVGVLVRHKLHDCTEFLALYGHVKTTVKETERVYAGVSFATVGPWDYGDHLHFGIYPFSTIPKSDPANGIGWGIMDCSHWPDTNGFVDPIEWLQTKSPYQSPPIITAGTLPDTGQTKCYDNTQEIPCPSPGEPFYGQDAQYASNPMSFIKLDSNGNPLPDSATSWEMVKDNNTGLIWQASDDQNTTGRTWQEAVNYCNSLNLGNKTDWRLPTHRELISIPDYGRDFPAIDTNWFPNCHIENYWSITNNTEEYKDGDYDYIWVVHFYRGGNGWTDKNNNWYVRCVRGNSLPASNLIDNQDGTITDTATGLMWQQADDGVIRDWQGALNYCESLPLGNKDDWRLPNIRELESIVDYRNYRPAISPVFNCQANVGYWSATTRSPISEHVLAWIISSGSGMLNQHYKDNTIFPYYVRCVRSNTTTVSPPPGQIFAKETHSQIDANETHWWDFINDKLQQLLIILGFSTQSTAQTNQLAALTAEQSTTFNIKIYKPDGTLYKETQSSVSPIQVQIPGAVPGQWRFEVTAIEVPYPDDPYVLAIGVKDKVALTPAILQLLLN